MTYSHLNSLIFPEIKDDELYNVIQTISAETKISHVLEIGSSSGGGSTEAFVKGIKKNPHKPSLYCMEVSQVRFAELKKTYSPYNFVHCYNLSSIPLENFPTEQEVISFYKKHKTNLNNYPLNEVIKWLYQDIDYVKNSGVSGNGIRTIKEQNNIDYFDVVLIDGSEFTGNVELDEVYGAKIIILDDANSFKNYAAHQKLLSDENYVLVRKNFNLRNGYSIFKKKGIEFIVSELPVHFFTIVLNGKPFIQYHIDIFKQLPFKWHWHIVEGVADLKHDTAWSASLGGQVTNDIHQQGLSKDGTTEYIDTIAHQYPENITVYRKSEGKFWNGKKEMVQAPLDKITEECLLWQVDVDELWTVKQICVARQLFVESPEKTAAYYWCWYFLGEKLVVSTRNCYTQNPQQEWLRTWRFKPGYTWEAHEPPILVEHLSDHIQPVDVAKINPFLHEDTEKYDLVFQHYAYVIPEQLKFKETYYGYKNAESEWLKLQKCEILPSFLSEYLSWVKDETMVDNVESLGIIPIAYKDNLKNKWKFLSSSEITEKYLHIKPQKVFPIVAIDAVFFQFLNTGIARVWSSLFQEWVESGFAKHILILDRNGTAPKIPGLRYRKIEPLNYNKTGWDAQMLQKICDEERVDIFMSTYYTTPISTPSIFLAHDMIPEAMNFDLSLPVWKEKHYSIIHACQHIAVSQNTAADLARFFPQIALNNIKIVYNGISDIFSIASEEEIKDFKNKYKIVKPYFIIVGDRIGYHGYKNVEYFFKAFSQLENKQDLSIVCVGGNPQLEPEMASLIPKISTYMLRLSDQELKVAYSGAAALVYPSLYEGFGLPVLEAMACGCPVITCHTASIPEVGGEAVIYVSEYNIDELVNALSKVQHPHSRSSLITAGLEQSRKFSWSKMAANIAEILIQTSHQNIQDQNITVIPSIWKEFRYLQAEMQQLKFDDQLYLESEITNLSNLKQAIELIEAMQTSKFWKFRTSWLKIKKMMGLPVDSFQPQVNPNQPIHIQLAQANATIVAMESSKFWKWRTLWFKLKKLVGLPID